MQTKRGDVIDVVTNETIDEMRLDDPLISTAMKAEFPEEKLRAGMEKEMTSMKSFEVYDEVHVSLLTRKQIANAIGIRWVLNRKEGDVRCRLVAQDYWRTADASDIFASTPLLTSLKLLLLVELDRNYRMLFGDASKAFLNATLPDGEEVFVKGPKEYYLGGDVYWRLKRPLYGLKTAPKNWQDYFADILISLGGKRLESDTNVYYFPEIENYVMVTWTIC